MKRTEKTNPPQTKSGVMTDSLGITQSSGLDHLSGHPDKWSVAVRVYAKSS